MVNETITATHGIEINKMLKNTFLLLGLTIAFSAICAGIAMALAVTPLNPWLTIAIYIGLLFAVEGTKETPLGLVFVFALTGFLGYTIGPVISAYVTFVGAEVVWMALGLTAVMFFSLSGYAIVTRKDFSFMTGFLMTGILVAFIAGLIALFFSIPALSLMVSGAFVFLSSGLILWQVSRIVNDGETNYISATVTLYVSVFNLFTSLLQLLGFMSDD